MHQLVVGGLQQALVADRSAQPSGRRLIPTALTAVVLPVFAILLASYATTRLIRLPTWFTRTLQRATFDLIVPVLLFHTMATVNLAAPINAALFGAYYLPTLALYALVYVGGQRLGRSAQLANMLALGSSYSNAVLLGIPLVLRAFGSAAAVPLFGLIALHSAAMFFLTTLLHEVAAGAVELRTLLIDTGKRLIANPILLGLIGGLIANIAAQLTGTALPVALLQVTGAVRAMAPYAALVAMGVGLASYSLRGSLVDAALISAAKLVLHPLLVAAFALWLLPVPVMAAKVAITVAALPSGINAYLFAARFGHGEAATATAIVLTTVLSMLTLSVVLVLLGI